MLDLDFGIKIAQIFTTASLGIAAWVVSKQQLDVSRSKQRLELYDRRKSILNTVKDFLLLALNGSEFSHKDCSKFRGEVVEAKFLFEKSVFDELQSIFKIGLEINLMDDYLESMRQGIEIHDAVESPAREKAELKKALLKKYETIDELFLPYLNLQK